jgi:hypothetical protein
MQSVKQWKAKSVAWSWGNVFVMRNATQVLLTNTNVIHKCTWSLSMRCVNADNIVYIPWVRIKRINSKIFQRRCTKKNNNNKKTKNKKNKNTQSTSKKVQSRINSKSTEKRAKIRWQINKLLETDTIGSALIEWPPSWKLICIVNWNDCNTGNWAWDAPTQIDFSTTKIKTGKQIFRDLRHLTFQVNVIRKRWRIKWTCHSSSSNLSARYLSMTLGWAKAGEQLVAANRRCKNIPVKTRAKTTNNNFDLEQSGYVASCNSNRSTLKGKLSNTTVLRCSYWQTFNKTRPGASLINQVWLRCDYVVRSG